MKIIIAILIFSVLILFHELGHFLLAKACGVGVTEFALGMGPKLVSWGKGETKYAIKALPFGGSCALVGEDEDDPSPKAFGNKKAWQRFLVIAAGPCFNFLLAFICSLFFIGVGGVNKPVVYAVEDAAAEAGIQKGDIVRSINGTKITIGREIPLYLFNHPLDGSAEIVVERGGELLTKTVNTHREGWRMGITYMADETGCSLKTVSEGSAAESAGLKAGDLLVSINGTKITSGKELSAYFEEHPMDGSLLELVVQRDGAELSFRFLPSHYETEELGFSAEYYYDDLNPVGFFGVIRYSAKEVVYWIRYTLMSLKMLISGQVGVQDLSGPVGIVDTIGQAVEEGEKSGGFKDAALNVLMLMILLNANLGLMNLLPIPALDGGRLLFILIELITGKRVPQKFEGLVHLIGFILLMLLMVFVLFNDVMKLFGK